MYVYHLILPVAARDLCPFGDFVQVSSAESLPLLALFSLVLHQGHHKVKLRSAFWPRVWQRCQAVPKIRRVKTLKDSKEAKDDRTSLE